jgi:hypothetical protein
MFSIGGLVGEEVCNSQAIGSSRSGPSTVEFKVAYLLFKRNVERKALKSP